MLNSFEAFFVVVAYLTAMVCTWLVMEKKKERERERVGNVTSHKATSGWLSCYKNDDSITTVFVPKKISFQPKNLVKFARESAHFGSLNPLVALQKDPKDPGLLSSRGLCN